MQVKVTSRHIELPQMAEDLLRAKVQKLERFGHKLNSVHAILGKEKYLYTTELAVSMKGAKLVGKAKHPKDLLTSMEEALAKVILQLKRREDKKRVEKRRRVPRRPG
jgi:ribosomal subunit interface protein